MLHLDSFLYSPIPTLPSWNAFTEPPVVPSSAAFGTSLSLVLPFPLFLSEMYLPPLRINLSHFALSSYKRALLPTSFPYFRFGQICRVTKTLQITLENICVHSAAHIFYYFSLGASVYLPCLSSLVPAFLQCAFDFFLSVLLL